MRWYLVIVFMLSLIWANGQKNQNLLFEKFSLQDGLAGNSIHEIIQDSVGFLWIATESGLSKFDGVSFKNYTKDYNNSFSLPSNVINKLYLDSKGILWVGTNYGICSYDPLLERFNSYIPHPNLLAGNQMNNVSGIHETSSGSIYFLVESGQLFSIQNGEIQVRLNIESEGSKFMMIDKQDRCWIAAEDIVYHFNVKNNLTTRHQILYPPDVSNSEITDMLLVDSMLYITSFKSDLICYNYLTGNHTYVSLLMGTGHTNSIIKEDDDLLIGTSEGLKIYNLKTGNIQTYQENISNIKSLSSNAIIDLYRDKQGNLWIGTGNGLNVAYRDKGFVGLSYNYNSFKKGMMFAP
jgi:ligand-binding sensor domain-containing protein